MRMNNNKGIALVISMLVMTFLIAFSGIFLLRVCSQRSWIQHEKHSTNAYYLAEAGAQAGLNRLQNLINGYLLTVINAADLNTVETSVNNYTTLNNSLGLLGDYVKHQGTAQFAVENGYAVHSSMAVAINGGEYQYAIRVRQKGSPAVVSDGKWDFYYYFTIESTGSSEGTKRVVMASGDFTVRVQKGDFAKQVIFNSTDSNTQQAGISFTASSSDITDKITWQEGQPQNTSQ